MSRSGNQPDLRKNYWAHCFEGALFLGGLTFVNPHTVLPRMCQALGAPGVLIALAPSLLMIGFIVPGLFVARLIESLPEMRPFVIKVGVWQRLPYLLSGLGLLLVPGPALALVLVALAPLLSGLVGGVGVNAWKEYVAGMIPERQRASLWALRFLIGSIIGLGGGEAVRRVLESYPGVSGYGLLHLCAAGFLFASFAVFLITREGERTAPPRTSARTSVLTALREVPVLLRSNPVVRSYALARVAASGIFVLIPFLGLRALEVLHKPDSYLGELVIANTLGALAGYLLGGYSGDRHGGKLSLVVAQVGLLGMAAWAPFASSETEFTGLFVLFGVSLSLATVGTTTLDLEIAPAERRPTYQALIGLFALAGLLLATLVSTVIEALGAPFYALAVGAAVMLAGSLAFLVAIPEPRRRVLVTTEG